ncbi:MAG: DUF4332 domain-containing protein [Candidatus Thorarchaeota archaeon]
MIDNGYKLVVVTLILFTGAILASLILRAAVDTTIFIVSAIAIVGGICSGKSDTQSSLMDSPEDERETYVPAVEEPRAELENLPIETIEGIGPKYGEMLRKKGIATVAKLVTAKAEDIEKICGVGTAVANRWIAMAEFCWLDSVSEEDAEAIVYGGGILDLHELAKADPQELFEEILTSVELGHVLIPQGYEFTLEMTQKWIAEAKERNE